jgi:hypothetical protein
VRCDIYIYVVRQLMDYSGGRMKKNKMGRECDTYGGREMCIHEFVGET